MWRVTISSNAPVVLLSPSFLLLLFSRSYLPSASLWGRSSSSVPVSGDVFSSAETEWATAASGQRPEILKSVEHLRDLTMFWFVSPLLARFHKRFRIDGWVLVMQLDLPSCALQASQTISQVHVILLLFCRACEHRVDGFGTTLADSSSLESPLQAPILKSQRKAKGVG